MGDLKTFWPDDKQPVSSFDLGGTTITSRGSDPNADGGDGPAALQTFWDKKALPEVPSPSTAESSNSVSGLPSLPNRFAPSETPPDPPDLTRRSPGTVDK